MTCSGCSFEAPADFAFCTKCGARLAGGPAPSPTAAPDGDRRPVTVLFADLAGFTALSEGLDPEGVRAIQADLFREAWAGWRRRSGTSSAAWPSPGTTGCCRPPVAGLRT